MNKRSPETTHRIMSAIHSKDTRPELLLRKELWKRGLRYRVNPTNLIGKPDIVFTRAKVAVFCDGDFWHGHNWAIRNYGDFDSELKRYSPYWAEKITRNVERDKVVTAALISQGWRVIRLWESDIKRDIKGCTNQVEYAYRNIMRNI